MDTTTPQLNDIKPGDQQNREGSLTGARLAGIEGHILCVILTRFGFISGDVTYSTGVLYKVVPNDVATPVLLTS